MNETQRSSPALLVSPEVRFPARPRAPAALQTCLVVSPSPRRARLWVGAAHQEQWLTIVCSTADDANRQAVRQRIDLALVDLQSARPEGESRLRELIQRLASRAGPLLAVCGKPDDTSGEVWARQLGVWLYLPGVDNESDIALLCSEARKILKKRSDSVPHPTT